MSLVLGVEILGEYKNLTAATKGAQTQLQKLNAGAAKISSGMNRAFASIGIGFSLVAITRGLTSAVEAAERVQESDQRLEAVATSMGIFGNETAKVTDKLKKYADRLELTTGIEAETIKLVQAKMFTFKELGKSADTLNGQFDRATKAALDLAAAGFGEATANATQLGKALQDPIKGLASLARSGVTFTAQQKAVNKALVEGGFANALVALGYADSTKAINDQIKAYEKENKTVNDLVDSYLKEMTPAQVKLYKHYEEGNHILEAQDNVLKAIEEQVGGTAEATAKSSAKIKNAFGQIEDAIGLALLPLLDEFSNWLATPEGSARLSEIIQFAKDVITGFANIAKWVIDNKDFLIPMVVAIGAVTTAFNVAIFAANAFKAAATLGLSAGALGAGGAVAGIGAGAALGGFAQGQQTGINSQIYGEGFKQLGSNVLGKNTTTKAPVVVNVKATQSAQQIANNVAKINKSSGTNVLQLGFNRLL